VVKSGDQASVLGHELSRVCCFPKQEWIVAVGSQVAAALDTSNGRLAIKKSPASTIQEGQVIDTIRFCGETIRNK